MGIEISKSELPEGFYLPHVSLEHERAQRTSSNLCHQGERWPKETFHLCIIFWLDTEERLSHEVEYTLVPGVRALLQEACFVVHRFDGILTFAEWPVHVCRWKYVERTP